MSVLHEMMPVLGRGEDVPTPTEKILSPDEQVRIDLSTPLDGSQEINDRLGIQGDLVATVNAGGKRLFIMDTRHIGNNRDFFIVDETFSAESRTGFKGVQESEPVLIGRSHHTDRFKYPATVSREQFEVLYTEEALFIRNLRPTNETVIAARFMTDQHAAQYYNPYNAEDRRTQQAEDRMQGHPNYGEKDETAPYGYYMNHPIIGRSSKSVDGGVYLGGSAREAIVVDGKSTAVKQAYAEVATELQQSFDKNETLPVSVILSRVMHRVQDVMPYDGKKTEDISLKHYGDKLIGLSTYVKERAGVCRHQGLLAAYIIENLINDGYIQGSVGVERNTVKDMGGTHAWAIYRDRSGGAEKVIVVDPAQSFVGTKTQALREGRWQYRLTTDEY